MRQCYSGEGILAGKIHFDDYWARDSFFASFGANALKDFGIVKKNLELYLRYMNDDGQLPRRIDRFFLRLKYSGVRIRRSKLKPAYKSAVFGYPSIDQNSLFVISLLDYVKKSRDYPFLIENFIKVKKAIDWNLKQDIDGDLIIEEGPLSGWMDFVLKRGKVFYSNVLHYKALADFCALSKICGKECSTYERILPELKKKIDETFWNGEFYSDFIIKSRTKYFETSGNVLAIIFGIAGREKAGRIFMFIQKNKLNIAPSMANYPKYSPFLLKPNHLIRGLSNYLGSSWLWIGCLEAIARDREGSKKEAEEELCRIAGLINRYGNVFEVYKKNGPAKSIFWRCESPFAWSAGLFIHACNETGMIR